MERYFLIAAITLGLSGAVAAAETLSSEHRLVRLCSRKISIDEKSARSLKYIRKIEQCISQQGGEQWWEEDVKAKQTLAQTCHDLQHKIDRDHARAYEQGKTDALWLREGLKQGLLNGYRFRTRQSYFDAALFSKAWIAGVLTIDPSYECLIINKGYSRHAWSSQHSGFSDYLDAAHKSKFLSLPER